MIQTFKVLNVKCKGCASTLTSKLKSEFGEITVNLEVNPREISLIGNNINEQSLRAKLIAVGYPMIDESLNKIWGKALIQQQFSIVQKKLRIVNRLEHNLGISVDREFTERIFINL